MYFNPYKDKADVLIPKLFYIKETLKQEATEPKKEEPKFGIFKKKIILAESKEETKPQTEIPTEVSQKPIQVLPEKTTAIKTETNSNSTNGQSVKKDIRIETDKLDYLLDMIGELVIAESLVTQNPDIKELETKVNAHLQKMGFVWS